MKQRELNYTAYLDNGHEMFEYRYTSTQRFDNGPRYLLGEVLPGSVQHTAR